MDDGLCHAGNTFVGEMDVLLLLVFVLENVVREAFGRFFFALARVPFSVPSFSIMLCVSLLLLSLLFLDFFGSAATSVNLNRLLSCFFARTVFAELFADAHVSTSALAPLVSKKLRMTRRRMRPRSMPSGWCCESVVTKKLYSRFIEPISSSWIICFRWSCVVTCGEAVSGRAMSAMTVIVFDQYSEPRSLSSLS